MNTMLTRALAGACLGAACFSATGQAFHYPAAEIERRNAAIGFALPRLATIALLREECDELLPSGEASAIATGWVKRNLEDIAAAQTWLNRYLRHAQATSRAVHEAAVKDLTLSSTRAVSEAVLTLFRRERPTAENCRRALKTFTVPQLDFQSMAKNPGYEQFAEFPATLLSIRSEADYRVDPFLKLDPDQLTRYPGRPASLEAAVAARGKGDGDTARSIFADLAGRGDGRAAQTLGLMYLNAEATPRDERQAYRWFYAAWSLGNGEGLNAMGVMVRDAMSVQADPRLAFAAFSLAARMGATEASRSRAESNAQRVVAVLKEKDMNAVACWSLQTLDERLSQHVIGGPPVPGRSISSPGRNVGELVPALQSHASGCK